MYFGTCHFLFIYFFTQKIYMLKLRFSFLFFLNYLEITFII